MAPSIQRIPTESLYSSQPSSTKDKSSTVTKNSSLTNGEANANELSHILYPSAAELEASSSLLGRSVGDSEAGHIDLDHTTPSKVPRDLPEHYERHPKGPPPRRHSDTDLHASFTATNRRPTQDAEKTKPRPWWDDNLRWRYTRSRNPAWVLGDGANDAGASMKAKQVGIDPYGEGRQVSSNYKLLISAIGPRPTALLSTRSKDGRSTNLAPYSYFQLVSIDPPLFALGFATGFDQPRDSLVNLVGTGECTINIVSEHFAEAASSCSMTLPYGLSEWATSGLTPLPSETIHPECSRVGEAIFAAECKLVSTQEFASKHDPKKKTSVLALLEATKFWVHDDAVDEGLAKIDPAVLRPLGRMGDITFCRAIEGLQIAKVKEPEQEIKRLGREYLVRRKHKRQEQLGRGAASGMFSFDP